MECKLSCSTVMPPNDNCICWKCDALLTYIQYINKILYTKDNAIANKNYSKKIKKNIYI